MDATLRSPSIPPPEVQPLELWGGVECTVNRVGDRFFDQYRYAGHDQRIDDLDAIAGLGVRTLRYAIAWERVAPSSPAVWDWTWSDARLERLRELGIRPIVGLVHHGSGPAYTDLLDPEFPALLAAYAAAFARRYPWIEIYTPINEPLTTARFSGLYGHWYPHRRDDADFCRMMIHQCRAVQLAMGEIRRINPRARLLQTEDLGLTLCTPGLDEQARFENERRFLSFDLACGRVDRTLPLYGYLRRFGVSDDELAAIRDQPPPDLLGANHYITSTRLLDERIEHYPADMIGGNGRQVYVDVEAVRVSEAGLVEPQRLLTQLWERYRVPIAITEVQLAGPVEDQIRWFAELWNAARRSRDAGVDIRAVTSWSLLGAFDWHCLVTREHGCYEPGAFDIADGRPRRTMLGEYLADLAHGRSDRHPALARPGWWRGPQRLLYPPVRAIDTSDGLLSMHALDEFVVQRPDQIVDLGLAAKQADPQR